MSKFWKVVANWDNANSEDKEEFLNYFKKRTGLHGKLKFDIEERASYMIERAKTLTVMQQVGSEFNVIGEYVFSQSGALQEVEL